MMLRPPENLPLMHLLRPETDPAPPRPGKRWCPGLFWGLLLLLLPVAAPAQERIYIDPGHGGSDPGAVHARQGTREADRVLVTGLELKRLLELDTADPAGGGSWTVKISRTTDVFVPLGTRSAEANAWGAGRFISIHQNAYNETANGTETFSLTGNGPAADLRDLIQEEALKAWGLADRGTKTAGFSVLRNSSMPAVLTEMGFIDSPLDHPSCASDAKCKLYARHLLFALQRHYGLAPYLPGAVTIVVDNRSPEAYEETGHWETSPYKGGWDRDSRWANVLDENPANTARFHPVLPKAGRYAISVWWLAGANRSPGAAFVIRHSAGSTKIQRDQREGGGKWNLLGEFDFPAGPGAEVVLSGALSAPGTGMNLATVISADAVRFLRVGDVSGTPTLPPQEPRPSPREIVIDNGGPDFSAPSGRWVRATRPPGFLGADYRTRRVEATSDPATWSADLPEGGTWEVFARWPAGRNRSGVAPYLILHQGGTSTRTVNQRKNDNVWVSLGTYTFPAGKAPRVLLSCWARSGELVAADAIKLVRR